MGLQNLAKGLKYGLGLLYVKQISISLQLFPNELDTLAMATNFPILEYQKFDPLQRSMKGIAFVLKAFRFFFVVCIHFTVVSGTIELLETLQVLRNS